MSPLCNSGRAGLGLAISVLVLSCDQLASGLRVQVTLDPELRSTCVRLRVHTSADTAAVAAEELTLLREAADGELVVAVYRDDLPEDVWLAAQPLYGTACETSTLKPNGAAVVVPGSFPASGLSRLEISLGPPSAAEDGDGDGFAGNGGPDCLDGNQDAHPEAQERCQQAEDYDCDGQVGCMDTGCPPTSCVEVPEALAFVGTPQTLIAGVCSSPVVVETRTLGGAPKAVTAPMTIAFASPDATLGIFANSSCTNATTQATVPVGTARAQVYVRGTQVGQGTLQATAPGLPPISQVHPVQAGTPAALFFLTQPQTVALNLCSGAVTVQLRDLFGNPAPVMTPRTVGFVSSAPSTTRFYSDPACGTTSVGSLNIPAGEHSLTFYFRSTASTGGTITLTAAAGTGPLTANQVATLVQRTPTQIAFTSPQIMVPQSQCSGALTLQAQDISGGAAPVTADTTVTLSASPSTLTFHSGGTCSGTPTASVTIANGTAQVPFSFVGSTPGTTIISATTTTLGAASQLETVTAAAPTQLVFASMPKTMTADVCSGAVVVETRDASTVRPVLADTTVTFTNDAQSGSFLLYLGNSCGGTPINDALIPAGNSSVTVSFRATRPPSVSLTASAPSLAPATQVETITAGAPASLVFTTTPQMVVESVCSAITRVELRDAYGNVAPAAAGGVTINLTSTFGPNLTFHSASTCSGGSAITAVSIASGSSTATFYFRSTQVGSPVLTATPAGGGITPATQIATISPTPPTLLAFSTSPFSVMADQCAGPMTVETRDAVGPKAVLADTTVNLTSNAPAGTLTFYAGGSCTGGAVTAVVITNGSSTGTVSFRGTRTGTPTITAMATGLTQATQQQTINPGPPSQLAFLGMPQSVPAGTCSALTRVELRDALGNPTSPSSALTVNLTSSSPGITFYSNSSCGSAVTSVTIGTAATTASFYFRGTQAAMATLDASATGVTPASQAVTIAGGPPVSLTFANPSVTVTAGQCSPLITLEARDGGGNLAPVTSNVTVTLSATTLTGVSFFPQANCMGTAGSTVTLLSGNNSVSFSFRTTVAGSGTIDSATASLGNDSLPATVDAAPPAALVFVGQAVTVNAGVCSGTVRALAIQLRDMYGNVATRTGGPLTVTLSAEVGSSMSFFGNVACGTTTTSVTIPNGNSTSGDFYFQTDMAGTWTITAMAGTFPAVTQNETVNPGPPAALVFVSTTTRDVPVNVCSGSPPLDIQFQDSFGNPSPVAMNTTVTITPSSWEFYDRSMCQSQGLLTAGELVFMSGSHTASFYFKTAMGTTPGFHTITVNALPLTDSQSWNIIP